MIFVFVKNKVVKANQPEFIRWSLRHAEKTLKQDCGAIKFEVSTVADDGETLIYLELWDSRQALSNHSIASAKREELAKISALRYDKTLEIYDLQKKD